MGRGETSARLAVFDFISSGMKGKWDKRVYVELYAGAGYSRIRKSSKIIVGSPLLALRVNSPFDKYIFCEESSENLDALRLRAERLGSSADLAFVLETAISTQQKF
jgi:three-Cys-motif partner protein